jgi:SAM-dependent methyltransferase
MSKNKYLIDETKPHLGGNFADGDPCTWCPSSWDYVIKQFNIKSVLDVGSGRGWAAKWFSVKGLKVFAIDGLAENVNSAVYPTTLIDLTERSYNNLVDFVNCIEVVEHIEEKYIDNLLTTLCQGRLVLMTHAVPGQKGWHHVNCQPSEYWIKHMQNRGYRLLENETKLIRELAHKDGGKHIARNGMLFERL